MVIELVAGRLVAPLVGNSLYTWTSIIGVILAGISLGNYIGGRLADRYASRRFLGVTFLLAALGSLSVLLLVEVVGSQGLPLIKIPLIARMILFITLMAGPIGLLIWLGVREPAARRAAKAKAAA